MVEHRMSHRGLGDLKTPARNSYFYGKLMDVWHFEMEQAYHNRKRWLLNRLAVGSGVLCGLDVARTNDGTRVRVGPGVAIDAFGREIVVPGESPAIDPRQPTDDCGQPDGDRIEGAGTVTLCLYYLECAADPTPALVGDCDTRDSCLPSTILERYRLQVRSGLPDPPGGISDEQCAEMFPEDPDEGLERRRVICETLSGACPEPDDGCVVLATVELAEDGTIGEIDTCGFRPVVYSNARLLDLILCLAERVDECCTPPIMLRYVSGDNQSAQVDSPVGDPLVVEVLQGGEAVADEPVTFEVVAGDGVIGDDPNALEATFETVSGADGRASLPIWQLGPNPGDNQVRARIAEGQPAEVVFRAMGVAEEQELPVVRAIWPPNAVHLSNDDEPEWLERWRDRPRLEITFNQEMDAGQLDDPDPWLRLWRIRSFGQNEIQVFRLGLRHEGLVDDPVLGEDGFTHGYRIGDDDDFARSRYLVQIRAENDNIVNTEAPPLLLDADFRGSRLEQDDLDRIWDIDDEFVEQAIWDRLVDSGQILPQSGDGVQGGRFNSWFQVMLEVD